MPVTSDQMIARMGLGAVQMFLFNGSMLSGIDPKLKALIIDEARERIKKDRAVELRALDKHPTHDSTILFTGIKR